MVKLNDSRPITPPALDAVRAGIEASLRDGAVDALVAELTANAEITRADGIDASVLSTLTFD